MYSQNVKLPNDFFKKDKNSYSDWTFAFFREIIQNSKDAGADCIDFNIFKNQDNDSEVIVEAFDNGKGMTKDILINVLLSLGGSLKDEGSIGGFGYAKIILFFSHLSYEIKTQNHIIKGMGGSYEYYESSDYIKGTHIKVTLENKYPSSNSNLERKLQSVLDFSSFDKKINFTLNGNKLSYDNIKYDYSFNTNLGKVNFKDNFESYSSLWIRVDGLAMFEHSIWTSNKSNFVGTLDLSMNSTEVMVSNRDSLLSKYSVSLNNIFQDLSNERASIQTETDLLTFVLNEENINIKEFFDNFDNYVENLEKENGEEYLFEKESYKKQPKPNSVNVYVDNQTEFSPFNELRNKVSEIKEKELSVVEKVNSEKYPLNFQITKKNEKSVNKTQMKNSLNKVKNQKISHLWNMLVNIVIDSENKEYKTFYFVNSEGYKEDFEIGKKGLFFTRQDRPVYTGFIFSDDSEIAVNLRNKDEFKILLNINKDLNSYDFEDFIDLACHEVAHIFYSNHDEDFSYKDFNLRLNRRKHYKTSQLKNSYKEIIKDIF